MPDTTDIIAAQVQAATAGEIETPDAPDVEATPEEGAAPAEGEATTEPSEPAPTPDEVEAALEAEGIKQRTDGRGENRIPYSRVKKMTEGMRKKLTEAHQAELKAERDKYASFSEFQEKANKLAYLDQLATHNPKAYLELLASANPAYRQFLEQKAEEQAAAVPTNDPMPPPDARFPDGSEGYTITQQQKKDEWLLRRAEERAFKRYQKDAEERFGPIAKEWQAGKAIEAQRPAVQQRLAALNQTWGKELIDKHEAEIVQAMRANPNLTAELVVAQVLLPKVREDQTAMKTRIVKELNARPAAAVRQAPAAVTASEKDDNGRPKSTEDTIRAELQRVGMLR